MVFIGVIEPEKRQILPSQYAMRKFLTGEIIEMCIVLKSSLYRIKRQSILREIKPHAGGVLRKPSIRQQGVIIRSLNAYASMTGCIDMIVPNTSCLSHVLCPWETENVFKLVTQ